MWYVLQTITGREEEPVSYTHLDVYKRQNLNLPVAMPVTVQLLAMGVSRQLKKKENESI